MTAQQTARMPEFLRPGDDEYEAAARTFFATGQPALVVRPRGPDEIATALTPRCAPRPEGVGALRRPQSARPQHQHRRDGDRSGAP